MKLIVRILECYKFKEFSKFVSIKFSNGLQY